MDARHPSTSKQNTKKLTIETSQENKSGDPRVGVGGWGRVWAGG